MEYDRKTSYSVILNEVHQNMFNSFKNQSQDKNNALELQELLQEIKKRAKDFKSVNTSISGQMLEDEFDQLINEAVKIQNRDGHHNFSASALFRRSHKDYQKNIKTNADDIFEEELAAILAALNSLSGQKNVSIKLNSFLSGRKQTGTLATQSLTKEFNKDVTNILTQLAEREKVKLSTQVQDSSGKIDIDGENVYFDATKKINTNLDRLRALMKDATFSVKNYRSLHLDKNNNMSTVALSGIRLKLGNTNLYKAITGALSEIGYSVKNQQAFFFRGITTMKNNNHGNANITKEHFSHLRFIYELRGSGLLKNGISTPVKYIIYNDPDSDDIFVRDTVSIIVEILQSEWHNDNLFKSITISANRVKS